MTTDRRATRRNQKGAGGTDVLPSHLSSACLESTCAPALGACGKRSASPLGSKSKNAASLPIKTWARQEEPGAPKFGACARRSVGRRRAARDASRQLDEKFGDCTALQYGCSLPFRPKISRIRWNEWRPKMENSFVKNGKLRSVSDLS